MIGHRISRSHSSQPIRFISYMCVYTDLFGSTYCVFFYLIMKKADWFCNSLKIFNSCRCPLDAERVELHFLVDIWAVPPTELHCTELFFFCFFLKILQERHSHVFSLIILRVRPSRWTGKGSYPSDVVAQLQKDVGRSWTDGIIAADSHHFSLVLKAEVMRAYYNSRALLHLHLISFNVLIAIYLFYQNSSFSSPLKLSLHHFPSSRHKGIQLMSYIMHQKCKLKRSSRRQRFTHWRMFQLLPLAVCLSQNRASFCLCALAAGPWSVSAAALEQSTVSSLPIASSSSSAKTGNSASIA